MTFIDEFSQDGLLHSGWLPARREADTAEALHERRRKDEIADSQRGSNAFAEIPDVDHSFILIDALQARYRARRP
jgi:hypothetical protein